jgi:uncharacterized protein DUF4919
LRAGVALVLAVLVGFGTARADVAPSPVQGGGALAIVLPDDGDEYSKLVARAAARDKGVDFRALRFAYLKSAAHKRGDDVMSLKNAMFAAVKDGDAQRVREAAVKLLSADYIDMYGQKFLRQSCAILHDTDCADQGHFVEFGLLTSVTASGDGKTCKTGWEVVSVGEEYFILSMMDVKVTMQSLVMGPPSCDAMAVTDAEGKPQTYYFRIDSVLEDEAGMLGH